MSFWHEWPLVVFTLASQLAVGCCLALLFVRHLFLAGDERSRPEQLIAADRWTQRPFLLAGVLMAIGLAASLLHLGAPFNAFRALANLGRSWLSREILAAILFFGVWAFGLHFLRLHKAERSRRRIAAATVLAGLLLIGAMAQVYLLPARPLWNSWLTPASFFLTTFLLGASAIAAHIEHSPLPLAAGQQHASAPLRSDPALLLLGTGVLAALGQLVVASLHPLGMEMRDSGAGALAATVRALLLVFGASLLMIAALARRADTGAAPGSAGGQRVRRWALAALLLLLASETVGRFLFFAGGAAEPF